MFFRKKLLLFVWIVLCLTILIACNPTPTPTPSPSPHPETNRPVIRLVVNPWVSAELNVEVARYILEEILQYPTEIVALDGGLQWEALAKGDAHASLEVWPSARADVAERYIQVERSIVAGSALGVVGKTGWYIPTYLLREHPELATWEGLLLPENAALFATERTAPKGQFFGGDRNWGHYEEDIFRNLNLDFQSVYVPEGVEDTEAATIAELDAAYKAEEPFIFYFWSPHWAYILYDLTEVQLPPNTEECQAAALTGGANCAYPADVLYKIYWSGFEAYAPDAYQFLQNFNYSNQDQIAMLARVQLEDMSPREAARAWISENEAVWRAWLPE